jgi:hypothetical protein
MMSFKTGSLLGVVFSLLLFDVPAKSETRFIAYSLREAALRAQTGRSSPDLVKLGGITCIGGMVYDREGKDAILVGLVNRDLPEASLDDLVVALRARLSHDSWPLVSIDPVSETEKTKLQKVRFNGHIEHTAFGRSFLDSDIVLKQYSLQMLTTIPEVLPYNVLLEDDIRKTAEVSDVKVTRIMWYAGDKGAKSCATQHGIPVDSAESYQARFWFYVLEPYVYADKNDVFAIKELRLALMSECTLPDKAKKPQTAQKRFAQQWTMNFGTMMKTYPVLKRLKVLYDLTAVAEAVRKLKEPPDLGYFLDGYKPLKRATEETYKLCELYGMCERSDGLRHIVRVSGGIELKAEIRWLNDGDFTPLRDIVLKSRPSPRALTWDLPLQGWHMQNARLLLPAPLGEMLTTSLRGEDKHEGCSVLCQSFLLDPKGTGQKFAGFDMPSNLLPPVKGVSMRMEVDNRSFRRDETGELDSLRKRILNDKPSSDSLK